MSSSGAHVPPGARRHREKIRWTVGRVCLWPNALFTGDHFEWRVPIDDENTLSVTWHFSRVPKEREPYVKQRSRPGTARSRTGDR